MHADTETDSHREHVAALFRSKKPMQKLDGRRDPRLIPGGWLLRASGLDELPQILNVVRGEMSLVGPRPCLPYEVQSFAPAQRRRFDAVPGLTGLWQVSGKNRTTFDTMIQLDVSYRERLSPWQDLWIIGVTVPVLLGQILETAVHRLRHSRPMDALPSATHVPPSLPVP